MWERDSSEEAHKRSVEFRGPEKDTDTYKITLPAGFEVDELPPPLEADYSVGNYHSKTEAKGNVLTHARTMEIEEVSVPVGNLKSFYRVIVGDERNTAVRKPTGK